MITHTWECIPFIVIKQIPPQPPLNSVSFSLSRLFPPLYSVRDRQLWSVSTDHGIALLAVSLWIAACPISLTSTTPYSAAPGEPRLVNSVPSPADRRQYCKVNRTVDASVRWITNKQLTVKIVVTLHSTRLTHGKISKTCLKMMIQLAICL